MTNPLSPKDYVAVMFHEEPEINPWPSLDDAPRRSQERPARGSTKYPQSATFEERMQTAPKLAKWFVTKKLRIASNDARYDEVYSDALLGILRAAQQHEPGTAAWSTFAVLCMRSMCTARRDYWRARKRTCPDELLDIDAPVEAGEEGERLRDTIANDCATPHDASVQYRLSLDLRAMLATLPAHLERIVRYRVGLRNGQNYGVDQSLDQVGTLLNKSRERVRQHEAKAFRALRHESRSRHIRPYTLGEY